MIDDLERKVYEILGVRRFQQMVFRLERIIHRSDGGVNQNYHFQKGLYPMDQFIKYLFFNGAIHIKNICLITVLLSAKWVFWGFGFFDIVLIIFAIKDLYCVMLQRYNYLRIKKSKKVSDKRHEALINKKVEDLLPLFKKAYSNGDVSRELEFIRRVKKAVDDKITIVIDEEDAKIIENLNRVIYQSTNEGGGDDG